MHSLFTLADVLVFIGFLALSLLVGIYHGIKRPHSEADGDHDSRAGAEKVAADEKRRHSRTAEFLTGGRQLPVIPVCLSLLTTFMSGLSLLATPSEIYLRGFAMGLSYLSNGFAFFFIGIFFIPVFYKLKFVNAYEYFEMRFGSRSLRHIATVIFMMNTLIYMAVVVYAPAVALAGVTDAPIWPFIVGVGAIATIYTAAGGIKAVIWTDTLQAVFLYAGLSVLLVKGTMDVGGIFAVFSVNELTGRLSKSMARFSLSLLQYHSFWIAQVGGISHHICVYGLNQMAMQRYCSMPSLRDAKAVMALTVPASFLISFMASYIGLLLAAYFNNCDPLALGEVQTPDQMTILMAFRVLEKFPGLPGVFIASLFSATLSTISSGINSMTAVLWEDFLKAPVQRWHRNRRHSDDSGDTHQQSTSREDRHSQRLMKTVTVFFGVVATVMAFMCQNVGGIFNVAITILGATIGPLVGLFFLGIFFPCANRNGAFAGLTASMVFMVLCSVANNVEQPYRRYVITAADPTHHSRGCVDYRTFENGSELAWREMTAARYFAAHSPNLHFGDADTSALSRFSPYGYAATGIFLTVVIGLVVSWLCPQRMSAERQRFSLACTYAGLAVPIEGGADAGSISRRLEAEEEAATNEGALSSPCGTETATVTHDDSRLKRKTFCKVLNGADENADIEAQERPLLQLLLPEANRTDEKECC